MIKESQSSKLLGFSYIALQRLTTSQQQVCLKLLVNLMRICSMSCTCSTNNNAQPEVTDSYSSKQTKKDNERKCLQFQHHKLPKSRSARDSCLCTRPAGTTAWKEHNTQMEGLLCRKGALVEGRQSLSDSYEALSQTGPCGH